MGKLRSCCGATRTENGWHDATVALIGNPNTGKTTLFNALTGLSQHTGNWPGKTVELAEGSVKFGGRSIRVVDLPGTYSLASDSPDVEVAREFIASGVADVVIHVVDATNLERNLVLGLEAMELTDKIVVALNMMDAAEAKGLRIDVRRLSERLGLPVVPTVASKEVGLEALLSMVVGLLEGRVSTNPTRLRFDQEIEEVIRRLEVLIGEGGESRCTPRWLAIALLKNWGEDSRGLPYGLRGLTKEIHAFRERLGHDPRIAMALESLRFVNKLTQGTISRSPPTGRDPTERLDKLFIGKFSAFPMMLLILAAIFWITIVGANPFSEALAAFFGWLVVVTRWLLSSLGAPWWLTGALADGLILGVGSVISVMAPTMAIFYVLFAIIEDAGLIPRIAFNVDRLMSAVGSQGQHCLTCMMAYGCNIPGVYSARIISDRRQRLIAILTNPLNPCNGRFGTMVPLAMLFFGGLGSLVLVALVLLSFTAVLLASFILSRTILRGGRVSFAIEMPPYRRPSLKRLVAITAKTRIIGTLWRAGIVAAPMSILIWVISNFPAGVPFDETYAGALARALEPLGSPIGLEGRVLAALIFAWPAKEIALASLAITSGLERSLQRGAILEMISSTWPPLTALNFLIFYMLYIPCTYTSIVQYKETGSARWAILGIALSLGMAYLITSTAHLAGGLIRL